MREFDYHIKGMYRPKDEQGCLYLSLLSQTRILDIDRSFAFLHVLDNDRIAQLLSDIQEDRLEKDIEGGFIYSAPFIWVESKKGWFACIFDRFDRTRFYAIPQLEENIDPEKMTHRFIDHSHTFMLKLRKVDTIQRVYAKLQDMLNDL